MNNEVWVPKRLADHEAAEALLTWFYRGLENFTDDAIRAEFGKQTGLDIAAVNKLFERLDSAIVIAVEIWRDESLRWSTNGTPPL